MAILAFCKWEIRNQVSECAEDLNLKPEGLGSSRVQGIP